MTDAITPERPPLPGRPKPSPYLRPLLALLAGMGIIVLITAPMILVMTLASIRGQDPRNFQPTTGYLAGTIVVIALANLAGGFSAAKITVGRSFYTIFLLAAMMLASGIRPMLKKDPARREPPWYPITVTLLAPVAVMLGGLLQRRREAPPRAES